MTTEQVTDIIRQALLVSLEISAPILIIAMVIGFGISLLQSVTQINEATLSFVPKIIVFAIALGILFPWMLRMMTQFTLNMFVFQWEKLTSLSQYAAQ